MKSREVRKLKLTMAKVHVSNVVVLNNPCPFYTPFQFEITFECIEELKEGKKTLYLTYLERVGSL